MTDAGETAAPPRPSGGSSLSGPRAIALLIAVVAGGIAIHMAVDPQWRVETVAIDVQRDADGLFTIERGKRKPIADPIDEPAAASLAPGQRNGVIVRTGDNAFGQIRETRHWGVWSLWPAVVAIGLCLLTREPVVSLLAGVISGAMVLGLWDVTDSVFLPSLASESAAGVLLLYLWLLGGLMGVWSKTGAAEAFAHWATRRFVRGPRSAKLVAWTLGVLFFQGGTVSTVLVGTCVKPIADDQRVSHEELSYVVDSTASPIAVLLAFNAWPGYVQALIFVPGVAALATEQSRLSFFFSSLPLSFYAIFAVLGTLLLSFDRAPILGRRMRAAIERARTTGELDAPGAEPLESEELQHSHVPAGYKPTVVEFALPLLVLIAVAIGTFITSGSPQVRWAFASALGVAALSALARGMSLGDLLAGIGIGLRGVVVASVILMLAITLGGITQQTGGGAYLVAALGEATPYWALPAALMLLTMVIAFATGTSWGTFAVAFPLAMPLAASLAATAGLEHPTLYLMVCFAAVLNGSVYGDQCSPISDTTILSAMTTGADLMDHVRTQLVPATVAAALAIACWQVIVFFC